MRHPVFPPAALLALFVWASGCVVTRADLDRQPYSGRVVPAAPTTVIADVLFSDDTEAELDRVRLAPNEQASRALVDSLSLWLSASGYSIVRQVAGVGLSADSLALFELEGDADNAGVIHSGPFVLDETLTADPALFAAARTPEQAPRADSDAEARRIVAVLRVRGRSVPVETSFAQAALTGLLTLGRKADFDRSALQAELFLLDAETGALVWARREGQQLQSPDVTAALALAKQLADTVPAAGISSPKGSFQTSSLGAP